MPNRISRRMLMLSMCATLAAIPASAQREDCARVGISIQSGTAKVAPGTTVGITGTVTNCGSRKGRYAVGVSTMSSCGQKAAIAPTRMVLAPGENTMYTVSYPIPANTCEGSLEATVEVRDNDGVLAIASTTIMIE